MLLYTFIHPFIHYTFTHACTNPAANALNTDLVEDNAITVMSYDDGCIADAVRCVLFQQRMAHRCENCAVVLAGECCHNAHKAVVARNHILKYKGVTIACGIDFLDYRVDFFESVKLVNLFLCVKWIVPVVNAVTWL